MNTTMTLSEFLHKDDSIEKHSIIPIKYALLMMDIPLVDELKQFNENTQQFFDTVKKIYHYITNPILIWNGFMDISYWICVIACISCFLMYLMTNRKKDIQRSEISLALYVILKLIDSAIKVAM